jgi:hypothetical protein
VQAPASKKPFEKRKHVKGPSCSGDQISKQEKALAKPLKQTKKFRSKSSGLSIMEKASSTKVVIQPITSVKINRGKTSSTSAGGGGAGQALTRALDLYASFATDEETIPPEPRLKDSQKSSPLKAIPKPSDASAVKGTSM